MKDFDWENEILLWTDKKRKLKLFQADFINFFQKAFSHTSQPYKSFFGTNDNSISLLTGGIFFAAYTIEGKIWLLLDKPFSDIPNSRSEIVKSTKNFTNPLFWLETEDLNNLRLLIERQEVWDSFEVATNKIFESKMVTSHRDHITKNKILLSDFFEIERQFLQTKTNVEIEKEFEEKVRQAQNLSKEKRKEILLNLDPKPTKLVIEQTIFNRNQYVVAEVLDRANGICERCKKAAPFLKDDGKPYLEVHHIKPLAENGDDTVENAIGLCPNCHRQAHYGKATY